MVEGIIAAVIMLYLISSIASIAYTASSNNIGFGAQNAYYDFSNILYKNLTLSRCLMSDNTGCVERFLSLLNAVYGLTSSRIEYGNVSVQSGGPYHCSSESESCYPFNGIMQSACLYICGG
jgi:hypothetical protein